MKKYLNYAFILFYLSLFAACANSPVETPLVDKTIIEDVVEQFPMLNSKKFGQELEFLNPSKITSLSKEQEEAFFAFYNSEQNKEKPGHQRLYEYLQAFGNTFTYKNFTKQASQTFATQSGNCMSLAVLTTALAKAANIDIKYQLVNRIPVYQEYGSVIFNAQHIRSLVFEPERVKVPGVAEVNLNYVRRRAIIDYFPSRNTFTHGFVTEDEFYAMYYRNLASEAIGENRNSRAYWLLRKSLEIEPENDQTINSLAVLHRRVGEYQKAEELYKYGIKHAINKIVLLKNYRVLLKTQNRTDDVNKISKELENLEDLNPFNWYHAANDAFDEGDYSLAYNLYNKAIELAPYLHQAHFGIAKTEFQRGNLSSARRALQIAEREAYDAKSKSIYEAKLAILSDKRFN